MSKTWEVVVWHSASRASRFEFATKEEAYLCANSNLAAQAIEVYGPDGEYEAS